MPDGNFDLLHPPIPAFDRFQIVQADAVAWLRQLPDESVDLVVTDVAYESLDKHRYGAESCRRLREWFPTFKNARYGELFPELYRVLKPNTHCYVFSDSETMFHMKPAGEAAGFKFWKPIVWDKKKIGMGYHYRAQCEFILFFEKGSRKLADLGVPDVLPFERIRRKNGFPTEKPVELLGALILQSSDLGALVVDPFMGSGATGEAALNFGRRFMGSDVWDRAIETAVARLEAVRARIQPTEPFGGIER